MHLKTRISEKRKNVIMILFSVCLSLVGVLTILLFESSLSKNVLQGLNVDFFTLGHFVLFILLIIGFYVLLRLADKLVCSISVYKEDAVEHKMIVLKVFIINIFFWGIWFWVYFPGTGMNDTINCIMSTGNDNQTLVYQLIIYYGIQIFTKLTNSMIKAYAILVIAQMILMSIIIAQLVSWLNKKGIRRLYVNLMIMYYALMPVIADYSITLVKDTLFSVCIAAVIPLLYDLVIQNDKTTKRKRFYSTFFAFLLGICVLRSNGIYIVFIVLLALIITKLKNKKYILSLFMVLLLINISLSVCQKEFISNDGSFRESIGVPLAQIGAVLYTDSYISETDRETLNNLLPTEIWKQGYCYSFADLIKFNDKFNLHWLNENKGEFIKVWFSVLTDNLGMYIKAYLCHTYGFWNIAPLNITSIDYTQSYFTRINNNTGDDSFWGEFCRANNLENKEIAPGSIRAQLDSIFRGGFCINLIVGAGIMLWLCVWCMIELIIYKKYRICLVFLPVLLNWATLMVAAPASFIYRYSFYLVVSLPLLFLITLMQVDSNKNVIE